MVKSRKMIRKIISDFYMVLILIFLYAPILTMMVLSFNQSKSRARWGGFTLDWYLQMFDSRSIMSALSTTLIIAFVSALAAAVIGTAAAIAIQSMRLVPRTIIMGIDKHSHAECRYCYRHFTDAVLYCLWRIIRL